MSYFSKNLRFLRNSHKLSQDGFAKAVGLNRGNIASYEKGLAEPNAVRLLKIARFFEVSLEDMIEEDFTASGRDYAYFRVKTQKKLTLEGLAQVQQEARRLDRILSGLQEFHSLRQKEEVMSSKSIQSLLIDHERLLDAAKALQQLLVESCPQLYSGK